MKAGERILVTGATGFIGRRVIRRLQESCLDYIGIARSPNSNLRIVSCDLLDRNKLGDLVGGVSVVIHCAGFAHALYSAERTVKEMTWKVNYLGTKNLLEQCEIFGVKKFINLSSVKAMSEPDETCIDEGWPTNPVTEYGKSKLAAEELIRDLADSSDMHTVNLRLAMVYGSGGKGNLERMVRLIRRGFFPPLPDTGNRRSLVHVEDVTDCIFETLDGMDAKAETFIVAGPDAPSGRDIYDAIRMVLGYRRFPFAIPESLLRNSAATLDVIQSLSGIRVPFNGEVVSRLLDSAWYSSEKMHRRIGWQPSIRFEDGLKEMIVESLDT